MLYLVPNIVDVSPHREDPACLMGKVSQLESMVKALQEDLKKVRAFIHVFNRFCMLHIVLLIFFSMMQNHCKSNLKATQDQSTFLGH